MEEEEKILSIVEVKILLVSETGEQFKVDMDMSAQKMMLSAVYNLYGQKPTLIIEDEDQPKVAVSPKNDALDGELLQKAKDNVAKQECGLSWKDGYTNFDESHNMIIEKVAKEFALLVQKKRWDSFTNADMGPKLTHWDQKDQALDQSEAQQLERDRWIISYVLGYRESNPKINVTEVAKKAAARYNDFKQPKQ